MRVRGLPRLLSAVAVIVVLAGCLGGGTPGGAGVEGGLRVLLNCAGGDGNVSALETSFLGSCWGHIGHHTYFVDPPVLILGATGRIFAVEAEVAGIEGAPELPVEVSLDGRAWTRVAAIPYPAQGTGLTEERHEIPFEFRADGSEAFRFLRVHMPRSQQEGLAGYLDHSEFHVDARAVPLADASVLERRKVDCKEGVLESFFAAHPCWFGGYDRVDAATGAAPSGSHTAVPSRGSYYDSPSFFHTYYLGSSSGGTFEASLRVQHWRTTNQFARCTAAQPSYGPPLAPVALVQASADGATWVDVARASGEYDVPIHLTGELSPGVRLVRFATVPGPGDAQAPPCHHPVAFLVESRVTLS